LIRGELEGAEMIITLAVVNLGVSCAKSVGCTTNDKIATVATTIQAE
jgi:hypothetical protein